MNERQQDQKFPIRHDVAFIDGMVTWPGSDEPMHQQLRADLFGSLPDRVDKGIVRHRPVVGAAAMPDFALRATIGLLVLAALSVLS